MTALYHDIIYGPVHSRRLGLSLGVNLLPTESKLCSFDCIYCECGWNAEHPGGRRFNAREEVRRALLRVDNNILKLDSAFDATVRRIDNPQNPAYAVRDIVREMKRFEGHMILQTMFLRGVCNGEPVDNTTEEEVSAWLRLVEEIRPQKVMVYSLDRDTPCPTLEKVPREELQTIAARVEALGIPCPVA